LRNPFPDAVLNAPKVEATTEIAEMKYGTILWSAALFGSLVAYGQTGGNIYQATLGESGQRTAEVSTEQLTGILADKSAVVLDARPRLEYAISHIPGALNVAAKPGVPMSVYVSDIVEVGRLLEGKKLTPLVLYCNGPYCGKSKRLSEELLAAGYLNIRRYQLGIPVWRALGGVTEIEPDGLRYVAAKDQTAVFIDVREAEAFRSGSLTNAHNLPRSGVLEGKDVGDVKRAKDDGRLPMQDHNTRLIVIGRDAAEARYVAEALVREAFQNVAYFHGSFQDAQAALHPE
jgi:rhodanese-related sulfurtransferase